MSNAAAQKVTTAPATSDRWEDVVSVMGLRGDPSWCWCQHFRFRGKEWAESTTAGNREQLRQQVAAGPPSPGVVAYLEGKPVGWCAVGPKHAYPRLMASRMSSPATGFAEAADITGTWAVSCFVVRREQRRRGVSARLLRAAVEYAAANGARTVEGYPVDPRRRSPCPEPNCFTAPCQCSSRPGSPKSTGRPPRECWSASSSSSAREQVSDGGE
jgi:GNAT superfamily N-acetyltransferase